MTVLPVTSTILTIIATAKFLGIKNLALANKWSPEMNNSLGKFFGREGIRVVGGSHQALAMQEFLKLKGAAHTTLIYELAKAALKENPDADGLYIGGGSMLTFPIIGPLEKEFGKPVVTTTNALSWGLCHQLDCWTPVPGYGRLLESR
jgi:maleate cis-trans isomerase